MNLSLVRKKTGKFTTAFFVCSMVVAGLSSVAIVGINFLNFLMLLFGAAYVYGRLRNKPKIIAVIGNVCALGYVLMTSVVCAMLFFGVDNNELAKMPDLVKNLVATLICGMLMFFAWCSSE